MVLAEKPPPGQNAVAFPVCRIVFQLANDRRRHGQAGLKLPRAISQKTTGQTGRSFCAFGTEYPAG